MTDIPHATLANGNDMPILGLGTWQLTGQDCVDTITQAISMGYRHIDTADMYGNHEAVGEAIQGVDREDLFLTTKLWHTQLGREDVIRATQRFLEELSTEYIDLLLIHWPNSDVPIKDTLAGMQHVLDAGLVRGIGVSNFTTRHLEEAIEAADAPIVANQVEYHVGLDQQRLLTMCEAHDVQLVAYSPLGRAELLDDDVVVDIAQKVGATPAQVLLAWLRCKDMVAIPKASSKEHLEDNLKSLSVDLAPEHIRRLNELGNDQRLIDPSFAEFDHAE